MLFVQSIFYTYFILPTPMEYPHYVYVLTHLLFVVPLNLAAFAFAISSANKPKRIRERRIVIAGIIMICIILLRYLLSYVYNGFDVTWKDLIKFEMSEIAMYLLILAVFVIKKDWFYPIAYTVGFISCIAPFLYPYTVLSDKHPFQIYALTSFIFHALNGFIPLMLIFARGYQPKFKHFIYTSITSVFIFAWIYYANVLMDQNFLVLMNPSNIPVLNKVPYPYHIGIIFIMFNIFNAGILALSEYLYKKFYLKEISINKHQRA